MDQSEFLTDQSQRNTHILARYRALLAPATGSQLANKPDPKRWSGAELLEHLIMSGASYLDILQPEG